MLACGWCEPLQAARVSLIAVTFLVALAAGGSRLVTLDLAGTAGLTSRTRFVRLRGRVSADM